MTELVEVLRVILWYVWLGSLGLLTLAYTSGGQTMKDEQLPCGCIRNGQRCVTAQQLFDAMMEALDKTSQEGNGWDLFKKATKRYKRHREGK